MCLLGAVCFQVIVKNDATVGDLRDEACRVAGIDDAAHHRVRLASSFKEAVSTDLGGLVRIVAVGRLASCLPELQT